MKNTEYLNNEDGLHLMRQLVNTPKTVVMATQLNKIPFSSYPVTLQAMDEQGALWFIIERQSDHFKDIDKDNRVVVLYFDKLGKKYISIYGNITRVRDERMVDEFWNTKLSHSFKGKEDANLILLNMNIENAEYWNLENAITTAGLFKEEDSIPPKKDLALEGKVYINMQNH